VCYTTVYRGKSSNTHLCHSGQLYNILVNIANVNKELCRYRNSATYLPLDSSEVQKSTFFHTLETQDITIWVGFGIQVAKTLSYLIACQFLLFVALCDHNPPTFTSDGQHMTSRSNIRPVFRSLPEPTR